jgi:hypothetical protein
MLIHSIVFFIGCMNYSLHYQYDHKFVDYAETGSIFSSLRRYVCVKAAVSPSNDDDGAFVPPT